MTPFDGGKFQNDDNYYAAAFLIFWAKHLQVLFPDDNTRVLQWMSYWAISDVFEEGGFNSNEFNNLYGLQTIRGIKKPGFRAFELLQQYGSEVCLKYILCEIVNKYKNLHCYENEKKTEYESKLVSDDNGFGNVSMSTGQVYCLKNPKDDRRYSVFIANWNNYGFNVTEQSMTVNIGNYIENTNVVKKATIYRIDANNTDPLGAWRGMGSPEYPTDDQMNKLNESSQVIGVDIGVKKIDDQTVQIEVDMPIYSAAVIDLQY